VENLLTQIFRNLGKKTITLQHGYFSATESQGRFPFHVSACYELMISDYFFCWGESTRLQAIKSGVKAKIICVGPLQFIDTNRGTLFNDNNYIGVFMEGGDPESNRQLVSIANQYCKNYGIKYKLRAHFLSDIKDELISSEYFGGLSSLDETLEEFSNQVGICLVGPTTSCFIELLYFDKIVFKLYEPVPEIARHEDSDFFKIKRFDEIVHKMQDLSDFEKRRKELKDFYIASGDIRENYINAFEKIMNGGIS
jgi:hypothetical protein